MTESPAPSALTLKRRAAHRRGVAGEERAAMMLEAQGFTILARRLRTPAGEIDLIARRESLLIFCEVKLRDTLAHAAESLSLRQRQRIVAAAQAYLASTPLPDTLDMRFDAIVLARDGSGEHLPGAFECEG
ncbi:YraN family protein [Xanthobacter sp. TB0136]|uniref:YraN family protein n=1 Tax=Xanthobacter sp. TB0136 TaxID=3459177 RepID=UPI0040392DBC